MGDDISARMRRSQVVAGRQAYAILALVGVLILAMVAAMRAMTE